MPACFQLSPKGATEFTPTTFSQIDEEICRHFLVDVHPVNYYMGWYDSIGLRLAMGMTWDDIRAEAAKEPDSYLAKLMPIVRWLEEHYESNSFYQAK